MSDDSVLLGLASDVELWFDWDLDLWPLVMAVLVAVGGGLLGSVFLVRREALLGDSVSHSVLPGVAAGILFADWFVESSETEVFGASFSMVFVLAGALAAGLASTAIINVLFRYSRIKLDTALGAVFPAFFAAGMILIKLEASGAHFDLDCVFYGALEKIGYFGQVAPTLATTVLAVAFTTLLYKEILVTSFDRQLAHSLGVRVGLVNRLLVGLLAMSVVAAFQAVGAILVIAFLIVPPATATLVVDRFRNVLWLSALLGSTAAVLGSWLTIVLANVGLETARAPSIVIVAGLQFVVAFVVAPRHGVVVEWRRSRALGRRILEENLLGAIYRVAQRTGRGSVGLEEIATALDYPCACLRSAVIRCSRRAEIDATADGHVRLTRRGVDRVEAIIRAHRLWEIYMTAEMGSAPDHVHDAADRIEHFLQPGLVRDLDELLGHPDADPHGRTIPARE